MELGVTAVMLPDLDFGEQVELCASLGIRYYQYRPRVIPESQRDKPWGNWGNHKFDLTPDRLLAEGSELTKRLRDAGIEPWGTVPSCNADTPDDELRLHFEGAARAEAKCVRVAPPPYPDEPFDYSELLERAVERYGEIIETLAAPLGIKVIIETHCRCLATSPCVYSLRAASALCMKAAEARRRSAPAMLGVKSSMMSGGSRPVASRA
ncbi:sugar phosphate isomerase/epimerase family protein, partial [Planctomycetota bacterium]